MGVLFRVDSSIALGGGHVMRCLALARALKAISVESAFACYEAPGDLNGYIESEGFSVHLLGTGAVQDIAADAEKTISVAHSAGLQLDWLVVDHYALDKAWEWRVRPYVGQILAIDDLANREHDCDLLLDQNYHADMPARYLGLAPSACRFLLGPSYALLREEFLATRRVLRPREGCIKRILVSFGGSDPTNETVKVIEAIRRLDRRDLVVDIVLGAANPHRAEVKRIAASLPGISCHDKTNKMAKFMARADLAIGAGGGTTWERCCLGLPSIVICVAENQEEVSRSLAEAGYHYYLGTSGEVSVERIAAALGELINNAPFLRFLGHAGLALVDGRGAARVAYAMSPPQIFLRPALAKDSESIWRWRNAEEIRRYAFDNRPIPKLQHDRWYEAVLHNPSRLLLIGECEGQAVGVLRYDIQGEEAKVSVYLAPGMQGRGYGTELLRSGSRWLREHHPTICRVNAEVMPANESSTHAFLKAGYRHYANVYREDVHE